jgi:hypothetical protein
VGIDRPSGGSRRVIPFLIAETEEPPAYPISYPTVVARAENLNKHRQSLTHAAYSKPFRGVSSDEGSNPSPSVCV